MRLCLSDKHFPMNCQDFRHLQNYFSLSHVNIKDGGQFYEDIKQRESELDKILLLGSFSQLEEHSFWEKLADVNLVTVFTEKTRIMSTLLETDFRLKGSIPTGFLLM